MVRLGGKFNRKGEWTCCFVIRAVMPIRKVKGRSRAVKRRPAAEKGGGPEVRAMPEPEQLEDYDEAKQGVEDDAGIQEARSTIERLARKYLHKALREPSSSSMDIIRGDEDEREVTGLEPRESHDRGACSPLNDTPDPVEAYDFTEQEDRGEKGNTEREKVEREVRPTPTRPTKSRTTLKKHSRNVSKVRHSPTKHHAPPRQAPSLTSPDFKVPKPALGHSTPSSIPKRVAKRESLFGFESLESPLTLSPVAASPYVQETPLKSPEGGIRRSSSYSKLLGTYDIPLRKPTPKQQRRKAKAQSSSEVDKWAKELNAQFAEVEDFELAVE